MKQDNLTIIMSVVIFTGVFVAIFFNSFSAGAELIPTAQDWSDDVSHIAFKASEYWRTPSGLGGGSESFSDVHDISDLGIKNSRLNGKYTISEVSKLEFVLSSSNIINGSVVQTRVNYQGIAGLPVIRSL